jgi:hypothetical protein
MFSPEPGRASVLDRVRAVDAGRAVVSSIFQHSALVCLMSGCRDGAERLMIGQDRGETAAVAGTTGLVVRPVDVV